MDRLTADVLRTNVRYEPETGEFFWLKTAGRAIAGRKTGCRRPDDYIMIRILGKLYYAHRLAWLWMTGDWPAHEIDHKDLNRSNNKWSNLRQATHSENCSNAPRRRHNTSGRKGVTGPIGRAHRKRPYVAQIGYTVDGVKQHKYLGVYSTVTEAHEAWREAALQLQREFIRED